jgi:hypothetical protein
MIFCESLMHWHCCAGQRRKWGIAAGNARGPEKASFFRAQNPFNNFVPGCSQARPKSGLMVRREDRMLFVSSGDIRENK